MNDLNKEIIDYLYQLTGNIIIYIHPRLYYVIEGSPEESRKYFKISGTGYSNKFCIDFDLI